MSAEELVGHLRDCRDVNAVIAGDGDLTDVIATMIAAGWKYSGTEYVEGKRVRYLIAPGKTGTHEDAR